MLEAFRKYAVFQGRATRKEYWLFGLLSVVVGLLGGIVDVTLGTFSEEAGIGALSGIALIVVFIPNLAVLVRRLHDTDRTGWWALISLVPLVGMIVLLVFSVLDGTVGPNRFGDDPKGRTKGG